LAFLRGLMGRWFTAMSGPLTVPFAALALFVSSTRYRVLYGCLAVVCGLVAAYGTWRDERRKKVALVTVAEERLATLAAQVARVAGDARKEQELLIADLMSELQDNLGKAHSPVVGEAYVRPSCARWKEVRNQVVLPDKLRGGLNHAYVEIERWCSIVDSSVKPAYGSRELDQVAITMRSELTALIEELKRLG
ncbi:MAG TPA: hypothetical protein VEG08_00795, partial [Terriglobales bacterium]|nr:hypothetical protein [Terriglobales bacterium]